MSGRGRFRPAALALVSCGLLGACGETAAPPLTAAQGAVATWGTTGILYHHALAPFPNDNLRFLQNLLTRLSEGRATTGQIRVLYTSGCDPRSDPDVCQITSDASRLDAFFGMIATLGTIDFALPSLVTLPQYTVVIADFCDIGNNPGEVAAVEQYVLGQGRVLVLGDNFCTPRTPTLPRPSAEFANTLVRPLGIEFTDADPNERDPLPIPERQRVGVLEGVATLFVFRVVPQVVRSGVERLVTTDLGVLAALVVN